MKILMCNSFYYERGGAERCVFELTALLEKNGHEVIPFAMVHENNFPSRYSDYFVSHIDYPSLLKSNPSLPTMIKAVERVIYSSEAKQKITRLIADAKPDIAHIHGIGHEISPSILDAIKAFHIPIVQTLHDYGLLCPNTNFISRGVVCERCKGNRYYQVVLRRCKRNSIGASLLACLSQYEHHFTNIYERNVDIFISPSRFLQKKLIQYGVNNKIVVIPNFIKLTDYKRGESDSGYCLYAGRLVAYKGIMTMIEAAKLYRQARILIAGEGELSDEVQKAVVEHRLDNVSLLGFVQPKELMRLVSSANFTIFPSELYENYPMSIIESFACGKPVIASNIGALPDLVTHGWNGLLFKPGNAVELASHMQYLFDYPRITAEMGKHGYEFAVTNNNPDFHYNQIMQVYQKSDKLFSKNKGKYPSMKMRIAYLGVKGLPSKSGTERVIEAISTRMTDQFDITVYCDADYTPMGTHFKGIRLIRIPTIRGKHLKPLTLDILSAIHAFIFGHYDLIHMNGIENCFTLPLLRLRYKIVSTSHGNPGRLPVSKWNKIERFFMQLMEYPFLYLSNCPTTISIMDNEYFVNRFGKQVTYIPNGVDLDVPIDRKSALGFINNLGLTSNQFLLFIAGRVIERKGCHLLLEAINQLKMDIPVLVIGDLEQVPAYSQKLRELSINHRVTFIPPIADRAILFGILDLCKLFVFPSTAEGMSMMLLEAASLGISMVCSDIPENNIVLGDHVTYFISKDHDDLARKIKWAMENPDELARLAQLLKNWVRENYSWNSIASRYELLYRKLYKG